MWWIFKKKKIEIVKREKKGMRFSQTIEKPVESPSIVGERFVERDKFIPQDAPQIIDLTPKKMIGK